MSDLRQRIAALSPEKRARLGRRLAENPGASAPGASIARRQKAELHPVSFAQQRLWLLDRLEPNSSVYNVPSALHLAGPLDIPALEQSINTIVARHEALRTTFDTVDGAPVQVVGQIRPITLPQVDLAHLPADQRQEQLSRLLAEESRRPFDLSSDLMLRATLLRLSQEEHVLLLVTHHIAFDGWSQAPLFRELGILYQASLQGQPSPLPELPIQYADYTLWQRDYLQGETIEGLLTYWKGRLADSPPLLELPTDRPRPPVQSYRGATRSVLMPGSLGQQLETLGRREGVTLFMTVLAAFQTLLYRYTGQEDILVGCPIAGRTRPETEDLIGFFVNTLVLRTDLSGDPSFRHLLSRVRQVALGAYDHQDLPFERLVEELRPERNLSHNPVVQVMLAFENTPSSSLNLPGLVASPAYLDTATAKFDLTLFVHFLDPQTIKVTFEYSTDLFDDSRISRMLGHLQTLLEGVVANPDQKLSTLPLLTEAERHQLLVEWNDTDTDYPKDQCIHQLFEAQVHRTPNSVAVVFGDASLSYAQLNVRANQLARHLQSLGVGPEVLVGICLERSIEMIVALLAILKAGGAYVPLDPTYPKERLAFMMEDAGLKVLLTQSHLAGSLPNHQAQVVLLHKDQAGQDESSEARPSDGSQPGNLAYVMYTSGSTGRPKGVAVQHSSVIALISWARDLYRPDEIRSVLFSTSIGFDISVFELFVPLSCGGKVLLAANALQLGEWGPVADVSLINTVPSTMAELVRRGAVPRSVRVVNLVGEALKSDLAQAVYDQDGVAKVHNLYGPTEDTVFSTVAVVERGSTCSPPIGRPISNSRAYVLDSRRQPVPIGVVGELYIGGAGLARGYLNRPELTAERFVPDTFSPEHGSRLFRTGDLVRYLPDGNLLFLGRLDHQVKVRGFRVELGEIEAVLREQAEVQDAVVLAREDSPGDKRLVAYVVPAESERRAKPNDTGSQSSLRASFTADLRARLRARLPEYMVPSAFVELEKWPLTPNGKVDRNALPAPEWGRGGGDRPYVAPRDEMEARLAALWGETLGVGWVGVEDNFFDLGGHSLLATRLVARVGETFHAELPLRILFERPTVAGLAAVLQKQRAGGSGTSRASTAITTVSREGRRVKRSDVGRRGGMAGLEDAGNGGESKER